MKLVVESAESGVELPGSSADSNADPAKVGVWAQAFSHNWERKGK